MLSQFSKELDHESGKGTHIRNIISDAHGLSHNPKPSHLTGSNNDVHSELLNTTSNNVTMPNVDPGPSQVNLALVERENYLNANTS